MDLHRFPADIVHDDDLAVAGPTNLDDIFPEHPGPRPDSLPGWELDAELHPSLGVPILAWALESAAIVLLIFSL